MDEEDKLMVADGFDDCILGLAEIPGQPAVIAYDTNKMIEKLRAMSEPKMGYEEACEYFDFNILGAYMGELTPIYVDTSFNYEDIDDYQG